MEPLRGEIPPAFREAARAVLASGLLAGDVNHPSRQRLSRALESLDEYWRRSGGALANVDRTTVRTLIRDQLEDVSSWDEFQKTPVHLDVTALVPPEARAHLDALPGSLHLRGDAVSLEYEVREGQPFARVYLREGQARRLRPADLPVLDRPLVFAVRRRGDVLQAETLAALQQLLDETEPSRPAASAKPPKHHPAKHHGSRGMRGRGPRGRPRR